LPFRERRWATYQYLGVVGCVVAGGVAGAATLGVVLGVLELVVEEALGASGSVATRTGAEVVPEATFVAGYELVPPGR